MKHDKHTGAGGLPANRAPSPGRRALQLAPPRSQICGNLASQMLDTATIEWPFKLTHNYRNRPTNKRSGRLKTHAPWLFCYILLSSTIYDLGVVYPDWICVGGIPDSGGSLSPVAIDRLYKSEGEFFFFFCVRAGLEAFTSTGLPKTHAVARDTGSLLCACLAAGSAKIPCFLWGRGQGMIHLAQVPCQPGGERRSLPAPRPSIHPSSSSSPGPASGQRKARHYPG